ncbi:hypothetical protein IV203_008669 [Nitzschia inconspicua]|nr:hypothetical protein IV203_008669 [Nitzschia inconspicua]
MDQFRSEAAKCKERRKISTKRSARTNSHIRTILGQQTASQELDGIQTDPKMLSTIACESSKKARESAHRIARKLEQEIEQEVYVHERSKPLLSAKIPVAMDIDHRRRIPDFHWGAVVDAFTDTVTCGISSNVRH